MRVLPHPLLWIDCEPLTDCRAMGLASVTVSRLDVNSMTRMLFANLPRLILFALLVQGPVTFAAEDAAAIKMPNYEDHIKPIFRQYCLKCHGEEKQEADVNLQDFASLVRGGGSGKIVQPGRSSQSPLLDVLIAEDEGARMPPASDPLPSDKIALIRKWIDSGLLESAGGKSMAQSRDLGFQPLASGGDKPAGEPAMPQSLPEVEPPTSNLPHPILAIDASRWAPLVAAADHGQIRLIHTESQQTIGRLVFDEGTPQVIRFNRTGETLLVAGGQPVQSGVVVLFDVRSGKRLAKLGDEIDAIIAADLSPDQRSVALGGSGKVVKIISTTDGSLVHRLEKHTDWITAISYSPDGNRLATADRTGAIHLWDAKTGGIVLNLAEHKSAVRGVDWRGDSRMLVSAGEDGHLIWWDATDGFPAINLPNAHPPARPAGRFGTIPNGILAARFDAQGNLISAGRDRTVRYWSPDGKRIKSFDNKPSIPLSVVVSHDGKTLISGDADGNVRFWKP